MSKKSRNLIDRAEQRQAESDSKAAIYKQKKTADKSNSEDKRKKAAYVVAGAAGGAAALKTKQVGQLYKKNAATILRAQDREYNQLKTNDPKGAKKVTKGNKSAAFKAALKGRTYTGIYTSRSGKTSGMKMSEGTSGISRYSRLTGGLMKHGR